MNVCPVPALPLAHALREPLQPRSGPHSPVCADRLDAAMISGGKGER